MNDQSILRLSAAALLMSVVGAGTVLADALRDQVATQLQRHQIQVQNLDELNDPQLRQIDVVLRGGETQREMDDEIRRIVATAVPCLANDQIRAEVAAELAKLGIQADVSALSGQDVAEIYLIVACDECSQEARVRQVLDRRNGDRVGEPQLRAEVESCLRRMDIDTAELDALSPAEMAELELILGGGDSDAEKRQQAQRIIEQ